MKKKLFIILFIQTLFLNFSIAQNAKDTLVGHYLELAKSKIESSNYPEANFLFKKIFTLNTVLPDELAYHYGYTQLKLGKYKESKTALTKYLSLQGDSGQYSANAKIALTEADCKETGYSDTTIECDICYGEKTITINCRNCKGTGIETCVACKGSGVTKTTTSFGSTFQTCKRCDGEKIIKCTVCKNTLKEQLVCYSCNGVGRKKIRRKCTN